MNRIRVDELEGAERWTILLDDNHVGTVSRELDEPQPAPKRPPQRKRRKFKREPRK